MRGSNGSEGRLLTWSPLRMAGEKAADEADLIGEEKAEAEADEAGRDANAQFMRCETLPA